MGQLLKEQKQQPLVRYLSQSPSEPGGCGRRWRIAPGGAERELPLTAHVVEITDSRAHYHRVADEVYYILEGKGEIILDGQIFSLEPDTFIYIPAGVTHAARGKLKVLVLGFPDINDADIFYVD